MFSHKKLDMSPYEPKPNESPYTNFAKNLPPFSPLLSKPTLLWPNPRGNKSPSPWKFPLEEEDVTFSPFRRKEFSGVKHTKFSQLENEYDDDHHHKQPSETPRFMDNPTQSSPKFRQIF